LSALHLPGQNRCRYVYDDKVEEIEPLGWSFIRIDLLFSCIEKLTSNCLLSLVIVYIDSELLTYGLVEVVFEIIHMTSYNFHFIDGSNYLFSQDFSNSVNEELNFRSQTLDRRSITRMLQLRPMDILTGWRMSESSLRTSVYD
jgi:hypothetical protein